MKKLMFYCQHILGMGHLVRSMEIVRGLSKDFDVCFVNGGQVVQGFQPPPSIQVVNLPAIKTDTGFQQLQSVDPNFTLEEAKTFRRQQLLTILQVFRPDVLMVELFPFGRRRFSFELIPLLEAAKAQQVKIVCSLRDIVVTKQDQERHEAKIVRLMNQYFDQLLIHGDPTLHPLEESFGRIRDLHCSVHYTGYVVQKKEQTRLTIADHIAFEKKAPMILVSVGGGRFGHELLESMVRTAEILATQIPHQIQMFTGPFMPEDKFWNLKQAAQDEKNLHIHRYTPNLLAYMEKAALSISMAGYNTTMNILTTGVQAMMLPFTGNDDQEQTMRVERLSQRSNIRRLYPADLQPEAMAIAVLSQLKQPSLPITVDLEGVQKTAEYLRTLAEKRAPTSDRNRPMSVV
ncbi:MAG: glycosyltransferase [Cyanobacteria bacterium J06614_10]